MGGKSTVVGMSAMPSAFSASDSAPRGERQSGRLTIWPYGPRSGEDGLWRGTEWTEGAWEMVQWEVV